MKPSDFLTDIGRPVAYYPALARALGSVNAAILLCQIIYWVGKEADPDLGVYKTKAELTDETGLSEREQETAAAKLLELGLLTTNYKRLQHRMYYLLHIDALAAFWERHDSCSNRQKRGSGTDKSAVPEPTKTRFGNQQNVGSRTDKNAVRSLLTQETTAEITKETHTRNGAGECACEIAEVFDGLEGWLKREAR